MKLRTSLSALMMFALVACGGDSSGGGGPPEVLQMIKWTPSGDNQTDTTGQTLPLVLRVKVTVDGENSAGHEITFGGDGFFGPGSDISATAITGANGVATMTWTLPVEAGVVHATATLPGAVGSPLTYTATGIVGAAVGLNKISGDNQSTVRGEIFNSAFVVQVVDQYGNGKEGVMINWSVDGPADLLTTSSPTDALGIGNGYLTAHDTLGNITLTATVAGLTGSPQTFTASVIGATSTVQVADDHFVPNALTIQAGGAVRWSVVGTNGHTVTTTGGGVIPNSGILSAGSSWGPVLFTDAGVYTYACSEHVGMTGSITVNP